MCRTRCRWKGVAVPKKLPPEFKRDVVRVARRGDLSHAEVAADSTRRSCSGSNESTTVLDARALSASSPPVEFEPDFTAQNAALAA